MAYEKIVINAGYGGFSLSEEAIKWLSDNAEEKNVEYHRYSYSSRGSRNDPLLVKCVEALGNKASGKSASLVVQKVPKDAWGMEEYDGSETIYCGSRQSDFDIEACVFRKDISSDLKIAKLQNYFRSQNSYAELDEDTYNKYEKENEEAIDNFHKIRLGLK